jgi:hypothetical protein
LPVVVDVVFIVVVVVIVQCCLSAVFLVGNCKKTGLIWFLYPSLQYYFAGTPRIMNRIYSEHQAIS